MVNRNTVSETPSSPSNNPPSQELLKDVWERYQVYSRNATRAQNRFFAVRRLLACLSVIIVVLAVLEPRLNEICTGPATGLEWFDRGLGIRNDMLTCADGLILESIKFLLILLPIIVTAMLAFAVKFDRGNSWVLLRGNSEALKMEIYMYRTQAKHYRQNRNAVLAEKVKHISERIKSSTVHEVALQPYEWEPGQNIQRGWIIRILDRSVASLRDIFSTVWRKSFQIKRVYKDSRFLTSKPDSLKNLSTEEFEYQKKYADLDAERYLYFRLENQFGWYRKKCKIYDRQHQLLRSSIYGFAGLGTLFAAIEQHYLIPIAAAVSTALVNYLEYRRVEATLVGYNQAADALYDIHVWWNSLSVSAQKQRANFEKLVVNTEETIRIENSSWLQDMQERLSSLYGDAEGTSPAEEDEEHAAPESH